MRIVSILSDDLQHAGQIAYLRGYGIQVIAAVQTANQLYELYAR